MLGAFLPDLIDKPLGVLDVTASLHTVGHSVFVAAAVVAVSVVAARVRPRTASVGYPLAVGWLSHLAGDLPLAVPAYLDQYVWPVRAPPPAGSESLVAYAVGYVTSPAFAVELLLAGGAVVLLWRGDVAFTDRS